MAESVIAHRIQIAGPIDLFRTLYKTNLGTALLLLEMVELLFFLNVH